MIFYTVIGIITTLIFPRLYAKDLEITYLKAWLTWWSPVWLLAGVVWPITWICYIDVFLLPKTKP